MKKSTYIISLITLIIAIIATFFVPIRQIVKYEEVIQNGESLKFKLEGFDPYDAFRGRFVNIRLQINPIVFRTPRDRDGLDISWGKNPCYLEFVREKDGFGKLVNYSQKPILNSNFVAKGVISSSGEKYETNEDKSFNYNRIVSISPTLDLTRFYMNEYLAPKAEKELQKVEIRDKAYAVVKIKDNIAIIENIYIDDIPLFKYLSN